MLAFLTHIPRGIAAVVFALAAVLLVPATAAVAAAPVAADAVVSNTPAATLSSTDLRSDTPRLYFHAKLSAVPDGAALKTLWVAVNVKGAAPNLILDRTSVIAAAGLTQFNASLQRPPAGWPSGDYKVDLYMNDTLQSSVPFHISPD